MEGEIMSKRNLAFYWRIYRKVVVQDIKSKMSYRADFIISMIGMLAMNVAQAVGFYLIFQRFPSIAGWSYYEMIFIYGFSLVAATPAQCLFDHNWTLRYDVYSGDFIKYCFRPVNLFFYYMSEVFDVKGIGQFLFGVAAVVYSWRKLQLPFHWYTPGLFVAEALSASLFVIAILNIAAASCFWIINSFFILELSNSLRDFARYPVTIFNPALRIVFTFIIPLAFMAFYPATVFLRPGATSYITVLTPFLGAFFFYLSYKLWMKGAMSYNGTGS